MNESKKEITKDLLAEIEEIVTEIMLETVQSSDSELINRMFGSLESIDSEIRALQRVLKNS